MPEKSEIIKELQEEYSQILEKVYGTPLSYRFQTTRGDDGSEHLEIVGDEFHLVATERGLELSRRKTRDRHELFYWMIADLAFWRGCEYEQQNRIDRLDPRRMIFQKQLEILEKVDAVWAARKRKEISEILSKNPFVDRSEKL